MEQVKGVTYPLKGFLGPPTWLQTHSVAGKNPNSKGLTTVDRLPEFSDGEFEEAIKVNPGNDLYHIVIYLAPGDYHGFHSPAQWDVSYRRHFPGMCVCVSDYVVYTIICMVSLLSV